MTEDKMVGWHHRLNGHEFEQTLRDSGDRGALCCCSLWGHEELDMTEQLNHDKGSELPAWLHSQQFQISDKPWLPYEPAGRYPCLVLYHSPSWAESHDCPSPEKFTLL